MLGKAGLSFSFAKKAEPKRVVAALAKKKDDGRVMITGVEDGKVAVDGPEEAARKLTIPCKNPLEEKAARAAAAAAKEARPKVSITDESTGGLVAPSKPQLSTEDEEALRELKRDLAVDGDSGARAHVAPILMRQGSKQAREGSAPEASKDMFDNVPVEAYGEALLRGMGYDPSKHTTKPVFHSKQRDSLLGLGAKALLPSEKLPPLSKKAGAGSAAGKAAKASEPAAEAQAASAAAAPADAAQTDQAEEPPPAKQRRTDAAERPEGLPATASAAVDLWPSRGLLVRLRSDEKHLRQFRGAQAVVLELDPGTRSCRIKSRIEEKSHTLEGVAVSDLEPLVGPECTAVRVVRGPHKHTEAKLLRRSERRGVACIRLNGAESEVPLTDVCEFIAPRK